MPSFEHEVLVAILREHPRLVPLLLRPKIDLPLDDAEVTASAESVPDLQPVERRADLVLQVTAAGEDHVRAAIVVEVQLAVDPEKWWSWPWYVTAVRARLRCPVLLVVVALDTTVARWAAQPIDLDRQGSMVFPCVLGPDNVPVPDPSTTRRYPEYAAVSLLVHRNEPGAHAIGEALLAAARALDRDHAALYSDLVLRCLGDEAARFLEAEMEITNYEPQHDLLRRLIDKGREQGREQGLEQGREQGLEQGREEGRRALAAALRELLGARGFTVTAEQADAIERAALPELTRWLTRAAAATSITEVFAP